MSPTPSLSETTPLLPSKPADAPPPARRASLFSPYGRLLLTALLLSISFAITSTPMLYDVRLMSCDVYYQTHPPYEGTGDRCVNKEIERYTAAAISFMVTLTTISGTLNLFTTSYLTKRYGPKLAMVIQTAVPCLRNFAQTYAVITGGIVGIRVLQWTQLLTIFGGGAGYVLTSNALVAAFVTPEERTASFGVLQGIMMAGTAVGYTAGGLLDKQFGQAAPFQVNLCLLVLSTFLSAFFLPYVAPVAVSAEEAAKAKGIWGFLAPLRVFVPQVVKEENGGDGKTRFWGLTLLGVGVFTGVFASAYVPLMLQMVATNVFGFGATENGYIMSLAAISRALFLTLAFPRIIAAGRRRFTHTPDAPTLSSNSSSATLNDAIPERMDPPFSAPEGEAEDPIKLPPPTDKAHGSQFDLVFLRASMVLDAALTSCVSQASSGWHMYLAAGIIPLASGSAPAGKGVIMDMVPPASQPDALAAIALVETLAMTSTVSGFGFIFAGLSAVGKPLLVFLINAATALLAAAILMLVRFPRTAKVAPTV